MTTIVVTGAGGAPATNFIRSLRLSDEAFDVVGVDADAFYLQRADADKRWLIPRADDADYLPALNDVIEKTDADLVYAQPDQEIEVLSAHRDELSCAVFLPSRESVTTCLDKYASFERWDRAGLSVPETIPLEDTDDLKLAFRRFGPRLWVREAKGSFGKGSFATESFDEARTWVDFQNGWGHFTAARCLTDNSVTWQSIWWRGTLQVAQGRRRLYWEFANRTPTGVTGITGAGLTVRDPELDAIAERAIKAIDQTPHGIFSVDLTYDHEGVPNPTEINIGRFFTSHLFFSRAGLNMPLIYVNLALGRAADIPEPHINPLPPGLLWIRGMDMEPVLTEMSEIETAIADLEQRRRRWA